MAFGGGYPYGYNPYMGYTPIYTPTTSSTSSTTSSSVKKELKTEDNGYKWYKTSQDGKYGAEDYNHNTLIPLSRGYTSLWFKAETGHKGYFHVSKNGKDGACDLTGKEILEPIYESAFYSSVDGFNYKSSSGGFVAVGWELDSEGRAIRATVNTTLVEDFKYMSYALIADGAPDMKHTLNTCDGVRFDFASTKGKIAVCLMKDGKTKESMTITPSEASLSIKDDVIIIKFTEYGTSKAIQIIRSFSGFSKAVMWYDNAISNTGKLFGESGVGGVSKLIDYMNKYCGSDFDGQYRRIKNELERFTWKNKS